MANFDKFTVLLQLNIIHSISYRILKHFVLFVSTSDKVVEEAELGNKGVVYKKSGPIAILFTSCLARQRRIVCVCVCVYRDCHEFSCVIYRDYSFCNY